MSRAFDAEAFDEEAFDVDFWNSESSSTEVWTPEPPRGGDFVTETI